MNYKTIILFLSLILFSCNPHQGLKQTSDRHLEEAKVFSLHIVKNYFDGNCEKHYDFLSDEIILIDGNGTIQKSEVKEKICKSYGAAIKNDEKTYTDYLNDYKVEILNIREAESRFKFKMPNYYRPQEHDFFFIGSEVKNTSTKHYIWDDMFVFLIRKENGKWVVKGSE